MNDVPAVIVKSNNAHNPCLIRLSAPFLSGRCCTLLCSSRSEDSQIFRPLNYSMRLEQHLPLNHPIYPELHLYQMSLYSGTDTNPQHCYTLQRSLPEHIGRHYNMLCHQKDGHNNNLPLTLKVEFGSMNILI